MRSKTISAAPKALLGFLLMAFIVFSPWQTSYTRMAVSHSETELHITAWAEGGRVFLAAANPTNKQLERDIVLGTYKLGAIDMERVHVTVPAHSVIRRGFPIIRQRDGGQVIASDTVFVYQADQIIDSVYVQGLHPSVSHFRASSYVVRAGERLTLEIDLPQAKPRERITLGMDKTYELEGQTGHYLVQIPENAVHYEENHEGFSVNYGWNGVVLTTKTPGIAGAGIVAPRIAQSSMVGTAERRGGLTPPRILVVGHGLQLIDFADGAQ